MGGEKPKRGQENLKVPEILLMEREFEFVIPIPVEECVYRLQKKVNSGFLSSKRISFESRSANIRKFTLRQQGTLYADGTLRAEGSATTSVVGRVGFHPITVFSMVWIALLVIGTTGFGIIQLLMGNFAAFLVCEIFATLVFFFNRSLQNYTLEGCIDFIQDSVYPPEERYAEAEASDKVKRQ